MPITTPSLAELIANTHNTISTYAPAEWAEFNDVNVLATVAAGIMAGLHARASYISKQCFITTCDEATLTDYFGNIYGMARGGALPARLTAQFSSQDGASLGAGAGIVVAGKHFITDAGVLAEGGKIVTTATCVDTGALNMPQTPTTATLAKETQEVVSQGLITAFQDGDVAEDIEAYRARILAAARNPDHGGTASDFEKWVLTYTPATRAFAVPRMNGLGTVGVAFVCDARADIIPTQADIEAVSGIIDDKKYVTADVTVFAPTPRKIDINVSISPDTPDTRANFEAEVRAALGGVAMGDVVYISDIYTSLADTVSGHYELAIPLADIQMQPHEVAVLGEVTYGN